jgi:hypothetical protein
MAALGQIHANNILNTGLGAASTAPTGPLKRRPV